MKRDPIDYGKPIPIRLPPEVLSRVEALAKRIGEPRSTIMRIALRVGVEGLERAFESGLSILAYPGHPEERVISMAAESRAQQVAQGVIKRAITQAKASSAKAGQPPTGPETGQAVPGESESPAATPPPTVPREGRYPRHKRKKSDHS